MAVRFDAESDAYTASTGLPAGRVWTITCWIYLSADRNAYSGPWALHRSSGDRTQLSTDTNGTTLRLYDNNLYGGGLGGFPLTVGAWYKVAVTMNGTNAVLYHGADGGSLTSTAANDFTPSNPATGLMVGRIQNSGAWLNGRMAAFKMWQATLTEAEVIAEFGQYEPSRTANLLRFHPFETAGTTDLSGNGNSLTAGSTATTTETPGPAIPYSSAIIVTAPTVGVTVTPLAAGIQSGVGAMPDPVEVVVAPLPATAGRIIDVGGPVAVTATPLDLTVERAAIYTPATVTVTPLRAGVESVSPEPVTITVTPLPATVGLGGQDAAGQRALPVVLGVPPTRFLAQDIRSKRWLHWELPITGALITKVLSGPTVISGEFAPEIRDLADVGLEPHATYIHVEDGGLIRASGILQPTELDGETLALEATGVTAYPYRIPFCGDYTGIQVDPAEVVRVIWDHVLEHPDSGLVLDVRGTTPVRIGTPEWDTSVQTAPGETVDTTEGPIVLAWWEAPNCGRKIEDLARETPFDYTEHSAWNVDKTDVTHWVQIHYPRAGRRRPDLRFAQDENIIEALGVEEDDEMYASEVLVLGKGEGKERIRGFAARRLGNRIRVVHVVDDKEIDTTSRATAAARVELDRRQALHDITEMVIDARHPNARLGSFELGDDIPVDADLPYLGLTRQWERVLSYEFATDADSVKVLMRRAESFAYSGGGSGA